MGRAFTSKSVRDFDEDMNKMVVKPFENIKKFPLFVPMPSERRRIDLRHQEIMVHLGNGLVKQAQVMDQCLMHRNKSLKTLKQTSSHLCLDSFY